MVQCFVAECDHSYSKNQCSFFRLPSDVKARRKWEILSGRPPDCSNENSRICSCHFIGGVKASGPSLFKWKQDKIPYHGVKEEPEEKDIMNTQEGPGRPNKMSQEVLYTATVDTCTGAEAVEKKIMHFKEEDTTVETKATI